MHMPTHIMKARHEAGPRDRENFAARYNYNSTFAAFGSGGDSAAQSELVPCGPLSSRKSGWPRIWEVGGREGSERLVRRRAP